MKVWLQEVSEFFFSLFFSFHFSLKHALSLSVLSVFSWLGVDKLHWKVIVFLILVLSKHGGEPAFLGCWEGVENCTLGSLHKIEVGAGNEFGGGFDSDRWDGYALYFESFILLFELFDFLFIAIDESGDFVVDWEDEGADLLLVLEVEWAVVVFVEILHLFKDFGERADCLHIKIIQALIKHTKLSTLSKSDNYHYNNSSFNVNTKKYQKCGKINLVGLSKYCFLKLLQFKYYTMS